MVVQIPIPNIRNVTDDAERRRVILSRAVLPSARIRDVNFARWMNEAEEHARDGWDGVFFVVNVSDRAVSVDPVSECLVSDARETKDDGREGRR